MLLCMCCSYVVAGMYITGVLLLHSPVAVPVVRVVSLAMWVAVLSLWNVAIYTLTVTHHNVKYRARLKSDRSPAGSDRVRQKGLGFNL
jgi:hypothetical protein